MNPPATNAPSALPNCSDEFDRLTANAASSPAFNMMNEFCAGRKPQEMPVHRHAATNAAAQEPVETPSATSVAACSATQPMTAGAEPKRSAAQPLAFDPTMLIRPNANSAPLTHAGSGSTPSMNGVM